MIIGDQAYLEKHFERDEDRAGWVGFKIFNSNYVAPEHWVIEAGSTLVEPKLNTWAGTDCGAGINVAQSVNWIQDSIATENYDQLGNDQADVWRVFIPDEATIVVPVETDGKIRCDCIELIEITDTLYYGTELDYDDDFIGDWEDDFYDEDEDEDEDDLLEEADEEEEI